MFRTGQKIVCIGTWPKSTWGEWWTRIWHPYRSPEKGVTYTVANTYLAFDGSPMLELIELPSPETQQWLAGFFACGFRPAVDRKTDIAFAHDILRKVSKRVPARSAA